MHVIQTRKKFKAVAVAIVIVEQKLFFLREK